MSLTISRVNTFNAGDNRIRYTAGERSKQAPGGTTCDRPVSKKTGRSSESSELKSIYSKGSYGGCK